MNDLAASVAGRGPRLGDMLEAGERAMLFVAMLLFSQALLGPLFAPDPDAINADSLRLLWPPVYLATALLAVLSFNPFSAAMRASWIFWAPVALAAASVVWSVDADATVRRVIALAFTTGFAVVLAARCDERALLVLLGRVFGLLMIGSLAISILMPSIGVDEGVHAGAWSGLWGEKNTLGGNAARAAVVFAALAIADAKARWSWLALLGLAAFLAIASTSKTGVVALVFGLVVLVGALAARRDARIMVGLGGLSAVAAIIVLTALIADPAGILALLGRDATLTGRTDIWALAIDAIKDRPWTGYGYGAFWAQPEGPSFWIREATDWTVPSAHSGWLELMLALGVGGALAVAAALAQACWRAMRGAAGDVFAYFALAWFGLVFLFGLSESVFLERNSLIWVITVALATKLTQRTRAGARP